MLYLLYKGDIIMKYFENEQDFIKWVQDIIELNKRSAINYYEIQKRYNVVNEQQLASIAADPVASEQYAKEVMMTSATDTLLKWIFNGVIGTIDANDMTVEQNQFLNAHFDNAQNYSLGDKQKYIRNGFTQHGVGNFSHVPLSNHYNFGSYYFSKNSLFDKVFGDKTWEVEKEIFLPELLGCDKNNVSNILLDFQNGKFPVDLSSEAKQILFDSLYTYENFYQYEPIDEEINKNNSKNR